MQETLGTVIAFFIIFVGIPFVGEKITLLLETVERKKKHYNNIITDRRFDSK